MGTVNQTDISRAEWLRVAATPQVCAALSITTEGWSSMWDTIEWFRQAERTGLTAYSSKRGDLRFVAALFASSEREAAAFLLAMAPNTNVGDIDTITTLLSKPDETGIGSLHQVIEMLRAGDSSHENIALQTGVGARVISKVDEFFGFSDYRNDRWMDAAHVAVANGWGSLVAMREMPDAWVGRQSWFVNKVIQRAKAVARELDEAGY